MIVEWEPLDHGTYAAIYANIYDKVAVFGTHTCMEGCQFHNTKHVLTEWGFKDADAPLIRSIYDDGKWTYWIAMVKDEECS